jgi:K+-transporting ATPase ATPase A chain
MWYNTSTAAAQLLGRFFMVIPILAIAGNLARKKTKPVSLGTFPVTGPLFATLLVSTILIVGALTFFPALSLGPILEHLLMLAGKSF